MQKIEKITQSELLEKGWTKKLIAEFLGEPELKVNPYYKSGHPMKLWPKEEIEQVQNSSDFQKAFDKAQKRKDSAKKAVQTKYQKLLADVEQKTINVKHIADEQLVKETLRAKEKWYEYKNNYSMFERDVDGVDEVTLARWVVNYIRHNLTEYDEEIYNLAGKVGIEEAYTLYKNKVLDEIAKTYPKYVNECENQKL